jgi:hypothetical protein
MVLYPALCHVNYLIAVGANYFFQAGMNGQIHSLKRDSAEQNLIGIGQYQGVAGCPAVLPANFKGPRKLIKRL